MQTHPTRRRPLDVEEDLSWCVSLDSLEGVPLERSGDAEPRSSDHPGRGHRLLAWAGEVVPGVALALAIAVVADGLTHQVGVRLLGFASSPVSPILLAVVAGLLIRHLVGLPAVYEPGLRLCVRRVLRLGVALLGVRLSLQQMGALGLRGLPIILACIVAALALAGWASRGLRLPRRLGMLIAVGTSICGVSAVVATAPVIDAEEDQTSYAVATVALFGMIALLAYPFLAHAIFGDHPQAVGLFLGTSIHDTSQVTGAALIYGQQYRAPAVLDAAVVTKLVRNLCMIVVIPLMAVLDRRQLRGIKRLDWKNVVPLFVVGFMVLAALRTVGDLGPRPLGVLSPAVWKDAIRATQAIAEGCLLLAMAGVGLGTSLDRLGRLGWRPLGVGLAAAVAVGVISALLITWASTLHWV